MGADCNSCRSKDILQEVNPFADTNRVLNNTDTQFTDNKAPEQTKQINIFGKKSDLEKIKETLPLQVNNQDYSSIAQVPESLKNLNKTQVIIKKNLIQDTGSIDAKDGVKQIKDKDLQSLAKQANTFEAINQSLIKKTKTFIDIKNESKNELLKQNSSNLGSPSKPLNPNQLIFFAKIKTIQRIVRRFIKLQREAKIINPTVQDISADQESFLIVGSFFLIKILILPMLMCLRVK